MDHVIEQLVTGYERGQCSRRELLATLGMMMAIPPIGAPSTGPASLFRYRELNHVTLRVTDLARSKQFYTKLLGLPLLQEDKDSCFLGLGKSFLSLWADPVVGFDHWCVGIESFPKTHAGAKDHSRDSIRNTLEREGYHLRKDEGDSTIYVHDPDGNVIQLESAGFKPPT